MADMNRRSSLIWLRLTFFEKSKAHFHPTIYHGIYRDDGLVALKGKKSVKEIKDWLDEFQKTVDKAAGNQHLQFTAEIWKPDDNPPLKRKRTGFRL